MATKLSGFRRLPGTAREYVTPEGEVISYRAYRKALEAQGAVSRLDPISLANRRRAQRTFNDIVRQMANVQRDALLRQAEAAEELGDEEEAEDLREQARTVKSQVIKSDRRKTAMKDLESSNKERFTDRRGRRKYKTPEAEERARRALTALGRREGIPDWVPVGSSDKFRAGGLTRPRRVNAKGRNA